MTQITLDHIKARCIEEGDHMAWQDSVSSEARAKWMVERARIAGAEPMDSFGSWGAIAKSTQGYEQELWDKVAIAALAKSIGTYPDDSTKEQVSYCFDYADAFMTERAKRLKQ